LGVETIYKIINREFRLVPMKYIQTQVCYDS
jgi:hypothetical protein